MGECVVFSDCWVVVFIVGVLAASSGPRLQFIWISFGNRSVDWALMFAVQNRCWRQRKIFSIGVFTSWQSMGYRVSKSFFFSLGSWQWMDSTGRWVFWSSPWGQSTNSGSRLEWFGSNIMYMSSTFSMQWSSSGYQFVKLAAESIEQCTVCDGSVAVLAGNPN